MASRSRHLSIALLGALLALAAIAPGALAADVTVVSSNGQSKTFNLESLTGEFDVVTDYVVRQQNGATNTKSVSGISVARLLSLADADPAYSKVDIGNVRMTRTQIEGAGAVPALYLEGGQAAFIRTSYGPTDANAGDLFAGASIIVKQAPVSADDGPIATASATPKAVKAKKQVTFTAKITNAAAGQQFTYRWNFDDGTSATGESVKHSFKKRGTYRVLLTATPEGETVSAPSAVVVQVGAPVKSKKKRTGTGTNDSAAAPLTGAADGDAGNGDQAATDNPPASKKKKKRDPAEQPASDLEVVSGELMAASAPLVAQSTLAARSGQEGIKLSNGFEISGPAMAAILAVLLLIAGLVAEYRLPQRLRGKLRGPA